MTGASVYVARLDARVSRCTCGAWRWDGVCRVCVPDAPRLPRQVRREAVAALAVEGAGQSATSVALGADRKTVAADLARVDVDVVAARERRLDRELWGLSMVQAGERLRGLW